MWLHDWHKNKPNRSLEDVRCRHYGRTPLQAFASLHDDGDVGPHTTPSTIAVTNTLHATITICCYDYGYSYYYLPLPAYLYP